MHKTVDSKFVFEVLCLPYPIDACSVFLFCFTNPHLGMKKSYSLVYDIITEVAKVCIQSEAGRGTQRGCPVSLPDDALLDMWPALMQ